MNLQLLKLIADGQFHSGSDLAERLGVSRTTIWKQIQQLQARGVSIHSIRGRGYRVPGGVSLLDPQRLAGLIGVGQPDCPYQHLQVDLEIDSTNLSAQRALATGISGGIFVAEYQNAGRGRRGRVWESPLGANLYFSISWPFSGGVASLEGLSLVVGLAIKSALEPFGVRGVGLKWPNDVLLNHRKLSGVLVEVLGDLSGECTAIIGVGVNVGMPEAVRDQISQPSADLSDLLASPIDRNAVLAALVQAIGQYLDSFSELGFSPFKEEWHRAHLHQNREVTISRGDQVLKGICLGADDSGALRLQTDQGEQLVHGGEVSLRGTP